MKRAPVLVLGYGNPGRGDDALGPVFVTELERRGAARTDWPQLELVMDVQLQLEHTLELAQRELVLFADAVTGLEHACALWSVMPVRDTSYTSHELSPAALLHAYVQALKTPPPPCYVLGLRAERFDLGAPLSLPAVAALAAGLELAATLLSQPHRAHWDGHCSVRHPRNPADTPKT